MVALALLAGCTGGDDEGGGATTSTSVVSGTTDTTAGRPRAAARWEPLANFSGAGPEAALAVEMAPELIQWRARWTCATGSLKVETTPAPRRPKPLVDTACPSEGEGFSTVAGQVSLKVEATGPWTLVVEQQVDSPLAEALPAELAGVTPVLSGDFYNVEKTGGGAARIYEVAGATPRRILRFEDFSVSQNTDLFIWLSEAESPKTSAEAVDKPKVVLGELRSTLGPQNYEIPADLPLDRIRSIVIWCQPVAIVYSAAALTAP